MLWTTIRVLRRLIAKRQRAETSLVTSSSAKFTIASTSLECGWVR